MSPETDARASHLRQALVDQLRDRSAIDRDDIAEAFLRVPRHLFAPEATLEEAYADDVVRTKWDDQGKAISSVSAPWLQARMLAQAGIGPGMRVLEIGSGGFNGALVAELVGESGHVTSLDIDPEITARTRRFLDEAGYQRVEVVLADGEAGWPQQAPYDAIIVTVETADVPPAWRDQLVDGGRLVCPLRVRGMTRSLGLTREGDRLVSTSAIYCGFVKMQGAGARPQTTISLLGGAITLRFDEEACPARPEVLDASLDAGRAQLWTGVTERTTVSVELKLPRFSRHIRACDYAAA